jgi:pimeloyl-ACP methyl ester carboxylesterase
VNRRLIVAFVVIAVLAVGAGGITAVLVGGDDDGGSDQSSSQSPTTSETDPGDPAATEPPSPELAPFYSQELEWSDCESGKECAKLTVPIDYQDPDAGTIELALLKAPAEDPDARVGSLVVNPGGPGAPGTQTANDAESYFGDPLRESYDIIGFDPRGTGDSDPVDCLSDADLDAFISADPAPDDPGEDEEYADSLTDFYQGCVDSSDALIGHVSTNEAARDMDVLRAALREPTLTYLGFSYGTRLGATYAELFPDKVGRFVLDGATDPALSLRQSILNQAGGFQLALESYIQDCIDGGDCFLGDTVQGGLDKISGLLDQIDDDPLPTNEEDRDLEIGNAFYGLVVPLYSKDNWPYLTQGLQQAFDGDGSTLLLLSDFYGSRENGQYTDNSLEAIYAINCLDDPTSIEPGQVRANYADFKKVSPTFGEVFAWSLLNCRGLQVKPEYKPLKIHAEGAAPIVVIGTTRDPATPYAEAVALAKELDSGVLVSRDGDGHTAYNKGNPCIDTAVEDYLIEGTVPKDGLKC